MNRKVSQSIAAVLNCICAAVWNTHVFIDLAYGFPNILNMILAIVWDACAVIWLFRCLRSRKTSSDANSSK